MIYGINEDIDTMFPFTKEDRQTVKMHEKLHAESGVMTF